MRETQDSISNEVKTKDQEHEGPIIVAVGAPVLDIDNCESAVAISGAWQGAHWGLVGFDSLSPLQSLQKLVRGVLYPEMTNHNRLRIAEAIFNDLMASAPPSEELNCLMEEIVEMAMKLHEQKETES